MSSAGEKSGLGAAAGKWILAVDDQPVMRDVLERFLQAAGHFVSTAADAGEALFKLRLLPIDLIVLDLDMPGGVQLAANLKSDPATASRPLLLLSARHKLHEFRKLTVTKSDGFLSVPFSFGEVCRMAESLLGLAPGGRAVDS